MSVSSCNVSICDKRYHINAIWVNVRSYSVTCHIVSVITIIDIRIKEKIKRTPIRVSTSTLEDTLILQGRRYCTFYIASTPCYSSKSGGNVSCLILCYYLPRRSLVRRYCSVRLREMISGSSGKAGSTPAFSHTILPLHNLTNPPADSLTGLS